jgi:hypothetical protein
MVSRTITAILLLALLLVTCGKSPTNSPKNPPISLKITVTDANGVPKTGVRVSAWNLINWMHLASSHPADPPVMSTATNSIISFTLMDSGYYRLSFYDLDGHTVDVQQGYGVNGIHFINWTHDGPLARVYKGVLQIGDSTYRNCRFRDSIYLTSFSTTFPQEAIVGYTNSDGLVQTTDSTIFPYLYGLPFMTITNPGSPLSQGAFTFSDQAAIAVVDTAANATVYDTVTILSGRTTEATVVWNPVEAKSIGPGESRQSTGLTYQSTRGDLNCDGVAYQPSDAAAFIGYYLHGLQAFDSTDCSIEGSDVNADGDYLGVDDFLYLIRVILGDSQPFPKPSRGSTPIAIKLGISDFLGGFTLSNISGDSLGAVLVVVGGEVTPTLLNSTSVMQYYYGAGYTKILIYPPFESVPHTNGIGEGPFLRIDGATPLEIRALDGATVFAVPFGAIPTPTQDELFQNFPNPF